MEKLFKPKLKIFAIINTNHYSNTHYFLPQKAALSRRQNCHNGGEINPMLFRLVERMGVFRRVRETDI
jgi:hypothetical protein